MIQAAPRRRDRLHRNGPDETEPEGNRAPRLPQGLASRANGSNGPEWTPRTSRSPTRARRGSAPGNSRNICSSRRTSRRRSSNRSAHSRIESAAVAGSDRKNDLRAPQPRLRAATGQLLRAGGDRCQRRLGTNRSAKAAAPHGRALHHGHARFRPRVLSSPVPLTTETAAPTGRNLYEWTALDARTAAWSTCCPRRRLDGVRTGVIREVGLQNKRPPRPLQRRLADRLQCRRPPVRARHEKRRNRPGGRPRKPAQSIRTDGHRTTGIPDRQHRHDEDLLHRRAAADRDVPASQVEARPDLYEYDLNTRKLSDLTTAVAAGETADVRGYMLGASEEGATTARPSTSSPTACSAKRPTPRAKKRARAAAPAHGGAGQIPGATCNLYVAAAEQRDRGMGAPHVHRRAVRRRPARLGSGERRIAAAK